MADGDWSILASVKVGSQSQWRLSPSLAGVSLNNTNTKTNKNTKTGLEKRCFCYLSTMLFLLFSVFSAKMFLLFVRTTALADNCQGWLGDNRMSLAPPEQLS